MNTRVVFAAYYYCPYVSGLTLHVRGLAEGLARLGWDVHVVAVQHDLSLPRSEVIGGVSVHRVRPVAAVDKGMFAPGFVSAVRRRAAGGAAIVPVLPLIEAPLLAIGDFRDRTLPLYICDLRLGPGAVSRAIEGLAHAGARVAVRRAPAFFASSEEYIRASRVLHGTATPLVPAPPPIDVARFRPTDYAVLEEHLGLIGRRRIGFVGRLVAEKGILVLLDAFDELRREMPDLHLVIAGEGKVVAGGGMHDEIARRVGADERVQLTGFLPDGKLPAFYSMLDVLVLPSIDPLEAYGMVQVESMLCGTPVVASDMPGVRIPVSETGMGRLTPPGDAQSVARAIREILEEPESFHRPRAQIARAFDPEIPVANLDSALRRYVSYRSARQRV